MPESVRMKKLCDLYIRRVCWIGVLYCVVPVAIGYAVLFVTADPFRGVYVLRLILSLGAGGALAAYANWFALRLWLTKHRSADGPATVLDGALTGAAAGLGTSLVPPLVSFIATNHAEQVKTFVIVAWLAAMVIGAIIGGSLAAVGRKYVDRSSS